ncbi:MAG: indolepyruvate oxidoreductase subunit beta [Bacteroidales bacterium]|nr:indolepyruvate oxidoreductase subunit beta [Bacteroidales bacterium]MCF8387012.1 indolepyruvate oxidoreductase subunit beta [Bacteroidales bacterium]MCF8397361.1 indolepyruvate oxidoreductase subunit beta [Bacteroidales bacterium]
MKKDIILAGVGGQGILSIAATIGTAAIANGMHLKQAEVHGMSQRGGDVQSHLRISDEKIASDLIPQGQADLIISVEPMESLRYLPMLKREGWLITNTAPHVNIPNYPDIEKVLEKIKSLPRHVALDADKMAKDLGSVRATNIVVLGAAAPFLELAIEKLENAIRSIFKTKGKEMIELNLNAFRAGLAVAEKAS